MTTHTSHMTLNEFNIPECKERDSIIEKIRHEQYKLKMIKLKCDEKIYENIKTFFHDIKPTQKYTLKHLLNALYNFVHNIKYKNIDNIKYKKINKIRLKKPPNKSIIVHNDNTIVKLSLLEFINYFPRDTTASSNESTIRFNFRRQHVFEALCRILLIYNYDKDYWGKNKEFYPSFEKYNSRQPKLEIDEILSQDINDGSAAGSVDIFFKIPSPTIKDESSNNKPCLCNTSSKEKSNNDDLFILIQNKFFTNEYASANKYDVHTILNKVAQFPDDNVKSKSKLILMVNNKQSLLSRIKWTNMVPEKDILGVAELNNWFMELIYDMKNASTFEEFYSQTIKESGILQPKFHQQLFINSTLNHIKEGHKKFVWGAVPRSGKSYMIGGLISKRKRNAIIVLGAKTETEEQFFNLFKNNIDFKKYGIIKDTKTEPKETNIILISQEKLKINLNNSDKIAKNKATKFLEQYFKYITKSAKSKKPCLDIYFDEIHKGGSTEIASQYIVETLHEHFNIELFAMVTATYAKPTIAYNLIIDPKPPIIITWSYGDQQLMKKISDNYFRDNIIESRPDDIQKNVLKQLFIDYEERYQNQYLSILENEYNKYPELILCQPESFIKFQLAGNTFKLKCSDNAIKPETIKNKNTLYNPEEIFKNTKEINNLLKYIGHFRTTGNGKVLDENTIYGRLTYDMNYDVLNKCHTELWFLPYTNLYDECDIIPDEKSIIELTGEESYEANSVSLPHIEPLSRGLVSILLNNELFKDHYCFLIVHGQKITYINKGSTIFPEEECVYFSGNKNKLSINEFIMNKEHETFKKGKSLLILTGTMLRLGISLECADIAFNFDSISSIDLNYQTMFRVLTERIDKQYGYYFDFNTKRTITFLYEFNQRYSYSTKTISESVIQLQSLLYLFNYNGLGVVKKDAIKQLELYDNLHKTLELDEHHYGQYFVKNGTKSIIAQLVKSSITTEIKERLSKLNLLSENNKSKIKHTIKQGESTKTYARETIIDNINNTNSINLEEEEETPTPTEKDIGIYLDDYTSIVAIFSKEYNCNNLSISNCINNIKEKIINQEIDFCNCNTSIINVLGCYMQRIHNFDEHKFIESLDIFKHIIESNSELLNIINIIFSNISKEMGKDNMLILNKSPEEIQELIEQYLPIREFEKNKYGEVFTPVNLINEMLDLLPKSVWSNSTYKWLDPANGIGNFPMIIYSRLMKGLAKEFSNEKERHNHIIKHMLYMVELTEKNVAISRKIFGLEANIFCGSFFSHNKNKINASILKKFNIHKYDIIIGNPPFQEKVGPKKTQPVWHKFVSSLISECLIKDGYLVLVHPNGWRNITGNFKSVFNLLQKLDLQKLTMRTYKDGAKTFNGLKTNYDYYCLKNTSTTTNKTKINDIDRKVIEIDLNNYNFIPSGKFEIFEKLIAVNNEETVDIIYNRSMYGTDKKNMKDHETKEYKYPIIYTITQKDGIKLYYSSKKLDMFVPKVVWSNGTGTYPIIDSEGKYGLTQFSYGIKDIVKNLIYIQNAMNDPKFIELMNYVKFQDHKYNHKIIGTFKKDFWKEFDYKSKNIGKGTKNIGKGTKNFDKKTKKINKQIKKGNKTKKFRK